MWQKTNGGSTRQTAVHLASCGLLLVGLLFYPGASRVTAGDPAPKSAVGTADSPLDEVVARRKDLAAQIKALVKQDGEGSKDADPTDVSTSEDELEFLESLDAVYAQQQARIEQRQELLAKKKKAEEELETLRKFGPTEAKPYSFLLLENLRDELAAEEDRELASTAELKAAEQMLQTAHEHFDECETERRKAQEESSENDDKDAEPALAMALKLAKRQCQIGKELISARRAEVEVRTLRLAVCSIRKTQLSEKVDRISKDVRFTKQDLQDRVNELAEFAAELNQQLKDTRTRFQQAEAQQAAALKDLRNRRAPQSTIELATESWRVARDAQQTEISLLNERIGDSKRFHHYWACRYEVENGTAKPGEIAEWHESLSDLVDEIHDNQRSLEQRIETSRVEQAKLVQRVRNSDDPDVKRWNEFQSEQWQRLRDACDTHLVQLKTDERWSSRFLDELQNKLEPQNAENWWTVVQEQFERVWGYEIIAIDDKRITVGKIATLVLYVLLSVALASILSRILGRRVLPHFGLNEGASHAIQSITFYSLAVLFGVLSFQLVNVPLTAFAFLGGAIAIAIGFGSQDIANNFMSGIIILAEQPIRVGDIVMVDNVQGTVTHIGPRSTRIRTEMNHELIVPNSKLLSDKVTNLTLSDNLIQTAMAVSLAPKMSVRQAKQILLTAASSHPHVLKEPPPIVLFKQFGLTTMDFALHFWLRLDDDMQVAITQSGVRETINELFQQSDARPTITPAPLFNTPAPLPARANAA